MILNKEQEEVIKLINNHKNVLVTAQAGTGKTYIIQSIPIYAKINKIAFTSLTGISASYINGSTIHSWSGLGLYDPDKPFNYYLDKVKNNTRYIRKICNTNLLIIDEISMMPYEMLTTLDNLFKIIRGNNSPFGGLQLVVFGDWFQLPPINYKDSSKKYVFQNPLWDTLFPKNNIVILNKIMRQNNPIFQDVLNSIRIGKINDKQIDILKSRLVHEIPNNITRLYPIKKDIDTLNKTQLDQLDGGEHTYIAKIITKIPNIQVTFPKDTLISEKLILKKDAFVMFNRNIYITDNIFIPNGKCGTIKGFTKDGYPIVVYNVDNKDETYICNPIEWDYEYYKISQIPLTLAWNISIHKSQGSTLDAVAIDIGSNIFEYGQLYVAVSRCKSLENLYLLNFDPKKIMCDPIVLEYYNQLQL